MDSRSTGTALLVTGDHLLDYSYDGQQIEVTSVRHGRMVVQIPEIDLDDDLLQDDNGKNLGRCDDLTI